MPTYDYECDGCGHKFEEFQSMADAHLKKCPQCKKNKLRRLFGGGAAILFKGSGFYQTDYRSDSYKAAAKADSEGAKASSEPASGGKTESSGSGDTGSKASTESGGKAAGKSPKSKA